MTAADAVSQPRTGSPRRRILRAALRDAIALHRTYTGNQDAIAVYELIQRELYDGTPSPAAELGELPQLADFRLALPVICADGLSESVLAGERCVVPHCGKTRPVKPLAVTSGGAVLLMCDDHRADDVLETVR